MGDRGHDVRVRAPSYGLGNGVMMRVRINVTRKNLIAHCFYIAKISYSYAPLKLRLHGAKSRGDLTQVGLRDNKLFSALILTTRGGKRGRRVLRG